MEILSARFPAKQAIARDDAYLGWSCATPASRTIPNIAVTLDSFYYTSTYPKLSVSKRPVWIVNTGPGGSATSPPVQTEEVNPPGRRGNGVRQHLGAWERLAPHASTLVSCGM